jgi:hypothetical protein
MQERLGCLRARGGAGCVYLERGGVASDAADEGVGPGGSAIVACVDPERLERWISRAATASSVQDVLFDL